MSLSVRMSRPASVTGVLRGVALDLEAAGVKAASFFGTENKRVVGFSWLLDVRDASVDITDFGGWRGALRRKERPREGGTAIDVNHKRRLAQESDQLEDTMLSLRSGSSPSLNLTDFVTADIHFRLSCTHRRIPLPDTNPTSLSS
jgi:hypothetical protein